MTLQVDVGFGSSRIVSEGDAGQRAGRAVYRLRGGAVNGGEVEVRLIENTVYIHGNRTGLEWLGVLSDFYRADAFQTAARDWLSSPYDPRSSWADGLTMNWLVAGFIPGGAKRLDEETQIDCVQAVGIDVVGLPGSETAGETGMLYVASKAPSLPIRYTSSGGFAGTLRFSGWDKPLPVVTPQKSVPLADFHH
jgi:hypothetical protein